MSRENTDMQFDGINRRHIIKHVHTFKTNKTINVDEENPKFVDDKDYFTNNINQQNISRILRRCADEIDRLNNAAGDFDGYTKTNNDDIQLDTTTKYRGLKKDTKRTLELLSKGNEQHYNLNDMK